jgi:hypothetical protein
MNKKELLEKINADDPLGILSSKEERKGSVSTTAKQRLINGFQEISDFFEENKRLPLDDKGVKELILFSRLNAIKKDPSKIGILKNYDFYNLLENEKTVSISQVETLNDPFNLLSLDDEDDSIFTLKHIQSSGRIRPDYVAHRHICQDFESFAPLFKHFTEDLKKGRRKLVQFSEADLKTKSLFVLNGVLMILIDVETKFSDYNFNSGNRVREDGRTRCVFDNGTESKILFRSLGKALQKNGFSVSDPIADGLIVNDGSNIDNNDVTNGFLYVLRSKSKDPAVSNFKHLFKIGYCTTTISERVANARNDPTYLMADVQLMLLVKCFNMSVPRLEYDIHRFFESINIEFKIVGMDGNVHYPKEWFDVPLSIVEEAIPIIVEGTSSNYYYDPTNKVIIKKAEKNSVIQ